MKLSKEYKNQNPKIYGYGSIEQLMADPSRLGDDPVNPLTHYVSFVDFDNHIRYTPCTEAYFYNHRNAHRNEVRQEARYRELYPISIDELEEMDDFEFADSSHTDVLEELKQQELSDYLWKLVSEFDDRDRLIIKLYSLGRTDAEIAALLNKARSTIQERRKKLFAELKENFTKNQK
ncbi:MAG: sigma-70 family RNA polymerase sigma factor [Acholeplasmataceae bacterium]|nr:sigma-70 family RNA polymerase sigma factor [Acholeplasmataceae bacterium]